MNNNSEALNRYTHNAAHIKVTSTKGYKSLTSYFYCASVFIDWEDYNTKFYVSVRSEIVENLKEPEYYLIALTPKWWRGSYYAKLKDLGRPDKIQNFENGTTNYLYDLSKFKCYNDFKFEYQLQEYNLDCFRPECIGNVKYSKKQYRGNYSIYICDKDLNLKKEVSGPSWRQIHLQIPAISESKLQRYHRQGIKFFVMENGDKKFYILINSDKEKTFEMCRNEYLNKISEAITESPIIKKNSKGKYDTEKGHLKTEGWTTLTDKYSSEGLLNRDNFKDEYVCVNKPIFLTPSRKNEFVHKQNYLFECDKISLEEQVRIINSLPKALKDSILWVTYSGSKSIHVAIKTNTPDSVTKDERREIHRTLNELFFQMEADPSGSNASRICRMPNATRSNGRVQKAFMINDDKAIAYDVSKILSGYREEKAKLATKLGAYKTYTSSEHTLEALQAWYMKKPSAAKAECITYLKGEGTDWNRTSAVIRTLANWGWTAEEILSEAPYNDKWFKSSINIL